MDHTGMARVRTSDHTSTSQNDHPYSRTTFYERIEAHPWLQDAEFQAGLISILQSATSASTPERWEDLALSARCFYFNRKYQTQIDPAAYKTWRNLQPQSSLTPGIPIFNSPLRASLNGDASSTVSSTPAWQTASHPPLPPTVPLRTENSGGLSFEEIVRLITNGEPIPGIQEIPSVVLEEQDSGPTAAPKRKPWEKVAAPNEVREGDLLGLGEL